MSRAGPLCQEPDRKVGALWGGWLGLWRRRLWLMGVPVLWGVLSVNKIRGELPTSCLSSSPYAGIILPSIMSHRRFNLAVHMTSRIFY